IGCGLVPASRGRLLISIYDAAARQIVRRKLHGDFVACKDTNKIFAHLPGNMREHAMFVLQFDTEHGIGQRLNYRRHHFDGIFLRIGRVGFAFIRFGSLGHMPSRPSYQDGPCISRGRVNTQGPFEVTATVCSKWAEFVPSVVTAVQSSSRTRTSGPPTFTIGSIAKTMPSCKRRPRPGSP